jgi:hypothetical protein
MNSETLVVTIINILRDTPNYNFQSSLTPFVLYRVVGRTCGFS